jgi:hypothetical protein
MPYGGHRRPESGIVASYLRQLRRQARDVPTTRSTTGPTLPYVTVRGRRPTPATRRPPGPRYS